MLQLKNAMVYNYRIERTNLFLSFLVFNELTAMAALNAEIKILHHSEPYYIIEIDFLKNTIQNGAKHNLLVGENSKKSSSFTILRTLLFVHTTFLSPTIQNLQFRLQMLI